jgi:hypothetical protein
MHLAAVWADGTADGLTVCRGHVVLQLTGEGSAIHGVP